MKWIDQLPIIPLVVGAVLLGLAPFSPQPHLIEKIGFLITGTLNNVVDILDLLMHGALPIVLLLRLVRLKPTI